MTTDVAVREDAPLALRPGQLEFDAYQRSALLALGVSKDASQADLAVYAHVCQRTRLDPFTRQIYMIGRRTKERWQDDRGQWQERWVLKQTIQVAIDGFRVVRDRVAHDTGCEVEFEDTVWYDGDGREHTVWLSGAAPVACRVVLLKYSNETGRTLRYPAVLRTASYMQTTAKGEPVSQWKTQPEHMIEKCCEAFATRRAFPNDFSGVYLQEEMNGRQGDEESDRPAARRVTAADIRPPSAPADDEVAEGEIMPDEPEQESPQASASNQGAKQEAGSGSGPRPAPAGRVAKLDELLNRIPLGEPADVAEFLAWQTGRTITATSELTATEVRNIHAMLSDHVNDSETFEDAASAVWQQYRAARSAAGGESGA